MNGEFFTRALVGAGRSSFLYALANSTRCVPFSVNITQNSISKPFVIRVVHRHVVEHEESVAFVNHCLRRASISHRPFHLRSFSKPIAQLHSYVACSDHDRGYIMRAMLADTLPLIDGS